MVNIDRYQNYQWVVKAEQPIERYFTIEGQVGESVVDYIGKRVIVNVPQTADLSQLRITSVKLGAAGVSTMTPDLMAGEEYDFSRPMEDQRFDIRTHR